MRDHLRALRREQLEVCMTLRRSVAALGQAVDTRWKKFVYRSHAARVLPAIGAE